MTTVDIVVERLSADDPDLALVERIERLSLASRDGAGVAEELRGPFTHAWVARHEAVPRGFIVTWLVADELHVLDVAADPAFRRRGVGRALMARAIAFARQHGVRLVLLEVRRNNVPAVRLYRLLGFTVARLRSGYYDDGEDALEMVLVLDPETGDIVPGADEVQIEEA
jgi:ribosomal-protein-alanine N-acetyltransferase